MDQPKALWIYGFLWLAGFVLSASAGPAEPGMPSGSQDIAELVQQLGSNDFKVREEATQQLLKIGLPARQALLEGTKDADLEIRRRCRELIPAILEEHRQAKLAAFIADKDGKQKYDLPGWERYRRIAGEDADARQFFVDIQKADTGFLADAEKDLARAGKRCGLLCQNLVHQTRAGIVNGVFRHQPISVVQIAPLLLIAADPLVTISAEHRFLFTNLLYESTVQTELRGGRSTPFKKILLAWMQRQAEDESMSQYIFGVINNLELKEGLHLAVKAVRDKKLKGASAAHALVTIGRFGNKENLPLFESFLDDKTQFCGFGIGRAKGGNVQGNTEVRDVALAMLVRQTKQSFKDYGFAISGLGYDHLMNNANYLGFTNDKERDKALTKWKEWKAARKK